jgi:hypothetical protein
MPEPAGLDLVVVIYGSDDRPVDDLSRAQPSGQRQTGQVAGVETAGDPQLLERRRQALAKAREARAAQAVAGKRSTVSQRTSSP